MNKIELCVKFLENPSIDPKDGHKLRKDAGPYNKYMKMCKEFGLISNIKNKSTNSTPFPKTSMKQGTIYKCGFTEIADIDGLIIEHADINTIIQLLPLSRYINKLIETNKDILYLLELIKGNSIYNQQTQVCQFTGLLYKYNKKLDCHIASSNDLMQYVFFSLKDRKLNDLHKIINYFGLHSIEKTDNCSCCDCDIKISLNFYGELLRVIIVNEDICKKEILEDYLTLAPINTNWSFIETIFESLYILDIIPLFTKLINAAKAINNKTVFDGIETAWHNCKRAFFSNIDSEDEDEDDYDKEIEICIDFDNLIDELRF